MEAVEKNKHKDPNVWTDVAYKQEEYAKASINDAFFEEFEEF